MPGIARKGDSITTGHGCDSTTTITGGSGTVFVNNIAVERKGDPVSPHTIRSGTRCVPHSAVVNAGSGTVFVNGVAVARVGDSADNGVITSGSSTVFVN